MLSDRPKNERYPHNRRRFRPHKASDRYCYTGLEVHYSGSLRRSEIVDIRLDSLLNRIYNTIKDYTVLEESMLL